jgi:KaiC/GvpD/RAD55 family RecA-like ATPase
MLGKFIAGDFIAIVGEMHQMKTLLNMGLYNHDNSGIDNKS